MRSGDDTGAYQGLRADPYAIFQDYFFYDEVEARPGIIVIPRQQHRALGEANIFPYFDGSQIVDPYFFADPRMIADGQLPGIFDIDPRLEHYAIAKPGAEAPQEEPLCPRARVEGVDEKDPVHKIPQDLLQPGSPDLSLVPIIIITTIRYFQVHENSCLYFSIALLL